MGTLNLSVSNPAPGGGSSQSVAVTLAQPPATLTSFSPSSAIVGSSPVTVTITGNYFTPTALVYFGYGPVATTYISPTSLQFTLPSQDLTYIGNVNVVVRDPASNNNPSNSLTFPVVNPVPVLSSISPQNVTAGAPNFVLTLTGSNFVQSSTVLINGAAAQIESYPSATTASIIVPASAVSTVGPVSIIISNPAPGGGTSAPQTLNVISANNRIRTVNVQANDLGWDATHNLIVASTGSSITNTPNSIVTVDPLQGTVVTTQPLPSSPAGISVTDDGSYVYVTLPATGQIERFTLPSLTPDITFALGTDSSGDLYTAPAVVAAPGHPHTVAIARHVNGTVPGDSTGGVAVYDDGVARPNIAMPSGYYGVYDTLVWSADGTTLYGTNSAVSTADLDTFAVNNNGVTLVTDQQNALGEFVKYLALDTKTSRLIDGYGNVVTAATGQSVGQLQVQNTLSYEENFFALDNTQRVAFFLNVNGFYMTNQPNGMYIQAFNLDQFNYINSMLVEGLNGASTIIRWGTSGLAIAGSQLYLIDGSFVSPTGISSAVGGYVAPSPTLTGVTPASVAAGSPDTQVTLTGRDFTQASEVTWNNQNLPVDSVSDTQIVVTIPAAMLTTPVASGITVTNGPGTGSSAALGFSVLPSLAAGSQITVLNISGQDLAWDSTRNLLYVAVPLTDPNYPNTIAVIDPTKPAIQQTVPIADQPSAISLSDDNQYLYSGFYGQAIIQRYTLPSFTLDLTIPSGAGFPASAVGTRGSCTFAVDVKVAPGSPQTIAVTNGNLNIEPRGCGGLAIYDNATPRPDTLNYFTSADFTTLAWGADASTLFAQSDPEIESQGLYSLAVSASGPTLTGAIGGGSLGNRVHFDALTGFLFSDSGVITNPVGATHVGNLPTGGILVTDDTLKRVFVLSQTSGNSGSGQGAIGYTLSIYDLNTSALLNTIAIPDVLGFPSRIARWGANGLVFVTTPGEDETGAPGALYILQGSIISGTP